MTRMKAWTGAGRQGAILAAGLVALGAPGAAVAQDFTYGGSFETTLRYYPEDGLLPGETEQGFAPIINGEFNTRTELDFGTVVFEVSGLYNTETGEGYADIPRGYFQYFGEGWDVLVGSNIEYWGVSESTHVVDSINQRYVIDQTVDYISLGQPMVNLNLGVGFNSTLSLYGLLYFRDRAQPNAATRFRSPFLMSNADAVYEEGNGRNLDFAARFRTSFSALGGGMDLAVSFFDGTNRAPSTLPNVCVLPGGAFDRANCADLVYADLEGVKAIPYYAKLRRYGLESVYSRGDLQLTFEAAVSQSLDETYYSTITGAQYSFGGIGPTGDTIVAVMEYLHDNRSIIQPLTIYDDDVFFGFAYSGNDVNGTAVRGGMYYDVNTDAKIYTASWSRRIGDALRLEVAGFSVNSGGTGDPIAFAQDDDFLQVSLAYFF
ncbi:hypothetical protein LA6_004712 [Marinibacterium anthonyi]|nr:hypothetical protein LA6_004712 [Marinibacterium anthonyi]